MNMQWSVFTRAVVVTVSILAIVFFLYVIRPMIGPLIIAALLAYVLTPLVRRLKIKARFSHQWAVPTVYFVCLTLLIVIPSLLAPIAIREVSGLLDYLLSIETQLEEFLANPIRFVGQEFHIGQMVAGFLRATTESTESAMNFLETTSTSFAWLLVIMVSTYYLMLDGERLYWWLVRLVPESEQPYIIRLLQEMDIIWKAYLRGTLVLMLIVGVVFTIIWTAIGLPGAVALGLLTGLLTVIPDVGPAVAALLAVLVAYFQGSLFLPISNLWFAILVFSIYFVLIQIKSIWLRPRIMGRYLHMNEGIIFVSIIGAVVLWGILGGLIVVPLISTLGAIGYYIRSRLLGLQPWAEQNQPPGNDEEDTVTSPTSQSSSASSTPRSLRDTIKLSNQEPG